MTDEPPVRPPHPDYVAFTSAAYTAAPPTDVEAATAAWLEEQAGMPFIQEVSKRTFELMDLRPGASVLDVACGTGVMLPALAEAVGPTGTVTGLDHAPAFLARAERRLAEAGLAERVSLVVGDAMALPFPDGSFDVVHAERLLMHLPDPDRALAEMARVARPGGRVVGAEVYAAGSSMDHPDDELMRTVTQALVSQIRNPSMGIELRGRLMRAGLVDIKATIVAFVEEHMDPDEVDEIGRIARDMGERGRIEPSRAEAFIEHLVATNESGEYTGMAMIFVAAGTVPAGDAPPTA